MRCQNCRHVGDEVDFTPTDGAPAPFVCPECGSLEVFNTTIDEVFSDSIREDSGGLPDGEPA